MGQIKRPARARRRPAIAAPRVVVFAGPNGAGKSTHADAILQALGIATFVNADYIARGLSGSQPDAVAMAAGRIMLRRLHELAEARQDFAFESTLSSRSFAPCLAKLKANGMEVLPPPAALKSDMAKVGDTMLKEWLDKAGPEGKTVVDAYRK